jgi:hypothetical protein
MILCKSQSRFSNRRHALASIWAIRGINPVIAGVGVGLLQSGPARKVRLDVGAKRTVIGNVGPAAAGMGLALGEDWHHCVVTMLQSLGSKHVASMRFKSGSSAAQPAPT